MRAFAKSAGATARFGAGATIFSQGDPGDCMYIVQSGTIEMVIGDRVVEVCGANEAIGFMSMIDTAPRSSSARVKQAAEVSVIDQRKFRFMVDEVPNFALYIMGAMARRIRGMSQAM
jgi:CRP-like cAMP-binding protein